MSEIKEIVRGLTDGQRTCILSATHRDAKVYGISQWEVSGRSANSLGLKDLVRDKEIRSFTGRSRRGMILTPLGLAVREALLRKDHP